MILTQASEGSRTRLPQFSHNAAQTPSAGSGLGIASRSRPMRGGFFSAIQNISRSQNVEFIVYWNPSLHPYSSFICDFQFLEEEIADRALLDGFPAFQAAATPGHLAVFFNDEHIATAVPTKSPFEGTA
jgi:hypothetical protein